MNKKGEKLLKDIGEVDDRFVEEADCQIARRQSGRNIKVRIIAAAALCAASIGFVVALNSNINIDDPENNIAVTNSPETSVGTDSLMSETPAGDSASLQYDSDVSGNDVGEYIPPVSITGDGSETSSDEAATDSEFTSAANPVTSVSEMTAALTSEQIDADMEKVMQKAAELFNKHENTSYQPVNITRVVDIHSRHKNDFWNNVLEVAFKDNFVMYFDAETLEPLSLMDLVTVASAEEAVRYCTSCHTVPDNADHVYSADLVNNELVSMSYSYDGVTIAIKFNTYVPQTGYITGEFCIPASEFNSRYLKAN